jgi:hypothetical protein
VAPLPIEALRVAVGLAVWWCDEAVELPVRLRRVGGAPEEEEGRSQWLEEKEEGRSKSR